MSHSDFIYPDSVPIISSKGSVLVTVDFILVKYSKYYDN